MKFSLIYEAQIANPTPETEAQMFNDIVEQVVLADELGFDGVWAVEHTALTQYAHMSAPETFLAYVAGRTKRIEIGHGVVCLPPALNHPIKIAERIATLDILSGGRVNFGMGKGGSQQEAGAFGYELSELGPVIEEMMYLVPKILAEGKVDHQGKHLTVPARPIHPWPLQKPHPKLYMACTRPDSLAHAGSRGIGALVMGFGGPEEVREKNKIYREAFATRKQEDQVGFRPTEHLSALCPTVVLDDRARAKYIGARGQRFFAESIRYWYQGGDIPALHDDSAEENAAILAEKKEELFVAQIGSDRIVSDPTLEYSEDAYGTTGDCIRHVQKLINAGADEIMFLNQMGGIPQSVMMETIRNIGEVVIPYFRRREAEGQLLSIAAE